MRPILVELFKHNLWANRSLLAACAPLEPEVLQAATPGTYGTVAATLVHLLAAEGRYVELLTGQRRDDALHESHHFPGIEALDERARASGEALVELVGQVQATRVLRGVRHGEPYAMPVVVPFLQALNHATEHRAHVVAILSQHSIVPLAVLGAGARSLTRAGRAHVRRISHAWSGVEAGAFETRAGSIPRGADPAHPLTYASFSATRSPRTRNRSTPRTWPGRPPLSSQV